MIPEDVINAAFADELEKISGAKRFVRLAKAVQKLKREGAPVSEELQAALKREKQHQDWRPLDSRPIRPWGDPFVTPESYREDWMNPYPWPK